MTGRFLTTAYIALATLSGLFHVNAQEQSKRVVVTFYTAELAKQNYTVPGATVAKQYGRRLILDFGREVDMHSDTEMENIVDSIGALYIENIELDVIVGIHEIDLESILSNDEQYTIEINPDHNLISAQNMIAFQWNLQDSEPYSIKAEQAWIKSNSSESIVVSVIDTGLIEGGESLLHYPKPGYDFISDPSISLDGDGRDADPTDPGTGAPDCPGSSWHGTKITSVLAARHDSDLMKGVAQKCSVMNVRVLGKCSKGYSNDVADSIVYSAGGFINGLGYNPNPAKIISMSFAGRSKCPGFLQSAINQAISLGAILVAAAGNYANDISEYFPANCENVIAVAASTRRGSLASYSNYGFDAITAPGGDSQDPITVVTYSEISENGLGLSSSMGTSLAVPHISGSLAIWMDAFSIKSLNYTQAIHMARLSTREWSSKYDVSKFGLGVTQILIDSLKSKLKSDLSWQNWNWISAASICYCDDMFSYRVEQCTETEDIVCERCVCPVDWIYGFGCGFGFNGRPTCYPCPHGSYMDKTYVGDHFTGCKAKAGHYVVQERLNSLGIWEIKVYSCPMGHYCPKDSYSPTPCPANTGPYTNQDSADDCVANPGYYMVLDGVSTACPLNTTSQPGSTWLSQCVAQPGYYGNPGTQPTICPLNNYCPLNATYPRNCTEGSYTFLEGSSSITDCISKTPDPYIFRFDVGSADDGELLNKGPLAHSYTNIKDGYKWQLGNINEQSDNSRFLIPRGYYFFSSDVTVQCRILAAGARGGDDYSSGRASTKPGKGIVISTSYTMKRDTHYLIIIGHHGEDSNGGGGGGGGGTFFSEWILDNPFDATLTDKHKPILIAGGGAGEKHTGTEAFAGHGLASTTGGTVNDASAAENGGGGGAEYVAGGNAVGGGNGYDRQDAATGGGGYYGHGGNCSTHFSGRTRDADWKPWFGGGSFFTGLRGGYDTTGNIEVVNIKKGGFGGGGSGSWGGGGGGGYSGGSGVGYSNRQNGGGGGGSYDYRGVNKHGTIYTNWETITFGPRPSSFDSGYNDGNGFLILSVCEPPLVLIDVVCACGVGYYADNICIACPTGKYGKGDGYFSEQTGCIQCPLYTSSQSASQSISNCLANAGYYLPSIGSNAIRCPTDTYCEIGSTSPTPCPLNTKSPEASPSSSYCVPKPGYYGVPGNEATPCEPGYYCLGESINRYPCPLNTKSVAASPTILACIVKAGFYGNSSTNASQCPANTYCPDASEIPIPCPNYTSSPVESVALSNCTVNAGYFGTIGGTIQPCNPGYFCPTGSTFPVSCKVCTSTQYQSVNCTPTSNTQCSSCSTPYSCISGSYPVECSTTTDFRCQSCPPISLNAVYLSPTTSACWWVCVGAYYKNGSQCSACDNTLTCDVGFYPSLCYSNTGVTCTQCTIKPSGAYFITNSTQNSNNCQWACNAGYYKFGTSLCFSCNVNSYCLGGLTGPIPCSTCSEGQYESSMCTPTRNTICSNCTSLNCDPGFYHVPCTSYSDATCRICTGLPANADWIYPLTSSCLWTCNTGFYTYTNFDPVTHLIVSKTCNPCPTLNCLIGEYQTLCTSGSVGACRSCTNGVNFSTYTSRGTIGNNDCLWQCNAGLYKNNAGTCSICSLGNYCPAGSTTQNPCAAGFYCSNPQTQVSCTSGHYCPPGTRAEMQCLVGKYCPNTQTEITCTLGNYCLLGSTAPTPCEPGTYNDALGQSVCKTCPLGNYCPSGSTTFNPCSTGMYADQTGQSVCTSCESPTAVGKYRVGCGGFYAGTLQSCTNQP